MTRKLSVDTALNSLSPEKGWEFQRMVYGPGVPNFQDLAAWLASHGQKVTRQAVSTWYRHNRAKYQTVPPEMALWNTLTNAQTRRDRLQAILDRNWDSVESGLEQSSNDPKVVMELLKAIAALDQGVRVAAQQIHTLEVRLEHEKLVMATVHQVFYYLEMEMQRQSIDALRAEALDSMSQSIADRIAVENKFRAPAAVTE